MGAAASAAAGVLGSVAEGVIGAKAAKSAAAAVESGDLQAANLVTKTTADANPQIGEAAATGGAGATAAAQAAAADAAEKAKEAGATVAEQTAAANKILDPYSQAGTAAAGTLETGLAAGGDFNKTPTMADLQIDPGYNFRLQQGTNQLTRSAAARGGAVSGAALKDLNNYVQGSASQEYQNAFNRFEVSTQNRYNNLKGVADLGETAGTTQGNNLIGAAKYAGDTGIQTAEYGGNINENAAQFAGNLGFQGANDMARNTINAGDIAANDLILKGNAAAAGTLGWANSVDSGIGGAVKSVQGPLASIGGDGGGGGNPSPSSSVYNPGMGGGFAQTFSAGTRNLMRNPAARR
jgi:hypothetical protein